MQGLGIEVRAGECEVRGDDIGGIAVHIGRVSALADPNDVLVSSTLCVLVIGSGLDHEDAALTSSKACLARNLFAVVSP